MTDILVPYQLAELLCPVCGHSINRHGREGCYKHRDPADKTPGDYCVCRQSAADIAIYLIDLLQAQIDEARTDAGTPAGETERQ